MHSRRICLIATLAVVAASLTVAADEQLKRVTAADFEQAYARLEAEFHRSLERLAVESNRNWRPSSPATGRLLFVAPDEYSPAPATPAESSPFAALRNSRADAVFDLAKQAAAAGELSLAFQWATEALRENPDHAEARRVLGYERRGDKWLTAYGAQMADAKVPRAWHPRFGWIAPTDTARWEAGERLIGGRWITAAADAARRTRIDDGWLVRTDHFLVRTNHSLEAAAELAARLERLHQMWRQLFAGFYLTEKEVRELFAGQRLPRRTSEPMRVIYHRNKDEYVAALVRRQPRIAETLGIYFDQEREAHFFAGDDASAGTLYHEVAHQLFQESRPAARHVGSTANFWIVEGVATYFETLSEHAGHGGRHFTIGEASAGRMPAARERLLNDGFYVPLADVTRWGKDELQGQPDLPALYSQLAGLAAFLMDAERGRYREPLVRYLGEVYAGRDDAKSLSTATGLSNEALDAAYRRFMEGLP